MSSSKSFDNATVDQSLRSIIRERQQVEAEAAEAEGQKTLDEIKAEELRRLKEFRESAAQQPSPAQAETTAPKSTTKTTENEIDKKPRAQESPPAVSRKKAPPTSSSNNENKKDKIKQKEGRCRNEAASTNLAEKEASDNVAENQAKIASAVPAAQRQHETSDKDLMKIITHRSREASTGSNADCGAAVAGTANTASIGTSETPSNDESEPHQAEKRKPTTVAQRPGAYSGAPGEGYNRISSVRYHNLTAPATPNVDQRAGVDEAVLTESRSLASDTKSKLSLLDVEQGRLSPTENQDFLVEATCVDDDNEDPKLIVVAETVENECGIFGSKRNFLLFLLLLLGTVGLAVGITCGVGVCSANAKEVVVVTQAPSLSPTSAPTMAPTPFVIDDLPPYSLEALQDPRSPQSLAYKWVHNDPYLENYSNDRLLQRFALVTFYYATQGEQWINDSDWLSYDEDECTWSTQLDEYEYPEHTGYPCSEDLQYLYLTQWENGLAGTLPPELGLLTTLEIFDISISYIKGTIPTTLSSFTNMRIFWCSQNMLTGTFPTFFVGFLNLEILGMWGNRLSGKIPSGFAMLTSLQRVELSRNNLTGSIPPELAMLRNLKEMSLDRNMLEGSVPSELGVMTSLSRVWIHENKITGPIPSELGALTSLTSLVMHDNQITGSIPSEFGMLSNLQELSLNENMLTSSIPTELGSITSLVGIDLTNNKLEGNVGNLSFTSTQLEYLDLSDNEMLSGTVPSNLCFLGDALGFTCSEHLCGCHCPCYSETLADAYNASNTTASNTTPPGME